MAYKIAYQPRDLTPVNQQKKKLAYLCFIRRLQCCVTGREGVEAAHVSFAKPWAGHYGRAKGTKAPDRFALPLHPEAHASQHRMNEREWWEAHGIDPHELANTLWGIYSDGADNAVELCRARINSGLASRGRLPKSRDEA